MQAIKSINILLIEDNPGDIELTKESLIERKIKNKLTVISDGEEALNYLYQREEYVNATLPDIILLDLNLPKISGREILKSIKSDPQRASIPVVILSSTDDAADIREVYQLHANCFIPKPVDAAEFMKAIQIFESFWVDIVKLPS